MKRILVVEDDQNIRFGLVELLQSEGFAVEACERGDHALSAVGRVRPNLILLDVMLPGLSGYDICRQLRAQSYKGLIIMLTAKGQELDKVVGLDLGADDYVTKPFGLRELMARIHAVFRRERAVKAESPDLFQLIDCEVDSRTFELCRGDTKVSISQKELKLLHTFASHPREVLSRDRLLNDVWGMEYYGTTRTLDQAIVQIRKKLEGVGASAKQIETVHSVGYRWSGPV
jgi:DNA-binding response OmpR family regulator